MVSDREKAAPTATPIARYAYGTLLDLRGHEEIAVSMWLQPDQCDESVIALLRRGFDLEGSSALTDAAFDEVLTGLAARGRTAARITQAWSRGDTSMMAQICEAIQASNDPCHLHTSSTRLGLRPYAL